jgi:7-cyano-7-deazaguanine reductase
MANNELDNSRISKHLGQTSQYKSTYDSDLLVREPRSNNREYLNIFDDDLPFVGSDTWNAYECSFLLDNGRPVTGVVKCVYPCSSKYIVESKSIKLYFNSFNMTKMGASKEDAILSFEDDASVDLSELLETKVKVKFQDGDRVNRKFDSPNSEWDIEDYHNVDLLEDDKDFIYTQYTEDPGLLEGVIRERDLEQKFYSGLLKSNCRVTSQPDWGDVFIHIKSKTAIDAHSIKNYVVSYRDECHFHEEICECFYKRLKDAFDPSELLVMCLYARRGGIDINPVRASSQDLIEKYAANLIDPEAVHIKTSKQ